MESSVTFIYLGKIKIISGLKLKLGFLALFSASSFYVSLIRYILKYKKILFSSDGIWEFSMSV